MIWELPIRRCLNRIGHGERLDQVLGLTVKQRLLNEPFFLIVVDFIVWLIAAVVYTVLIAHICSDHLLLWRNLL